MVVKRCQWPGMDNPIYQRYHDTEWGKLNLDEHYLFEMLILESFQAGLSWLTILRKRDDFRQAFANFDVDRVAAFDDHQRVALLKNKGIIRNRMKVAAAINNAQMLVKMHDQGRTLKSLLTAIVPKVIIHHPTTMAEVPTQSKESQQLSRRLKKLGFTFVGPVTMYSYLEAVGLINDHIEDCSFKYPK